jgi:hypothetical protein
MQHTERQPKFITEKEVSNLWGRAVQTLRNDRAQNKGLPFYRFGRQVRYELNEILSIMVAHRVVPGADSKQEEATGDAR